MCVSRKNGKYKNKPLKSLNSMAYEWKRKKKKPQPSTKVNSENNNEKIKACIMIDNRCNYGRLGKYLGDYIQMYLKTECGDQHLITSFLKIRLLHGKTDCTFNMYNSYKTKETETDAKEDAGSMSKCKKAYWPTQSITAG